MGLGRYTQTYYGVTDAQSMTSRFRPYSTRGGIDSASMALAWNWTLSQHWSVLATGGVTRLLGRYGDSPIVQSRSNYYAIAGATASSERIVAARIVAQPAARAVTPRGVR